PPDQIEQDAAAIEADRAYLLDLLSQYFPHLELQSSDVINHYIGIRPLVDPNRGRDASGGKSLAKVSREHTIEHGPGGSVIVAGGKYTTFRRMAEEIVDFATKDWQPLAPRTDEALFPPALPIETMRARELAR